MFKKVLLLLLITLGAIDRHYAQSPKNQWVDSVYNALSIDQQIGQLFIVPVYPYKTKDYLDEIDEAIKSHHIGGLIFMEGGPKRIAHTINTIQQASPVPLFLGIDGEWGLGKHLDSTMSFLRPLALGAIQNDTLIFQMGAEISRQMKILGMHINLAPMANTLSKPKKYDSLELFYGQDRYAVTRKTITYLQGLQSNGIMACAKYFPVQGMTISGVGKDKLPIVTTYVDTARIYTFRKLIDHSLPAIITTSSSFPLFYENKKTIKKNTFTAPLLSSTYAGQWLKNKLKYDGLILVDLPIIKNKKYKGGDAEVLAFQAGNEIILFPHDIVPAIRKIKRLISKESHYQSVLERTVKRILAAKYDAGLHTIKPIPTDHLYQDLNTVEAYLLKKRLLENAVTIIKNERDLLPIKSLDDNKIALLSIGDESTVSLETVSRKFYPVTSLTVAHREDTVGLLKKLESFNTIVVALLPSSLPWQHSILSALASMHDKSIIILSAGSVFNTNLIEKFPAIVECYTIQDEMQKVLSHIIFGAIPTKGKLPVQAFTVKAGHGIQLNSIKRLGYAIPEEAGMDPRTLLQIDSIANEAIQSKATPGCHVLVAKDGKVVFEKSYGWLTYGKEKPVEEETIYDLASVTKVMATLQAAMFLYDRGLLDINKKASYYLPELKNSNKKNFTLKDILTHQAGLWPFLPFWAQTIKDSIYLPQFYSKSLSREYPYTVAENLYAAASMRDSLWNWIIKSKIREKPQRTPFDYRYSDMAFYILQHLTEKILNQPMEDFLNQNLYEPLGATTTGYLPLERFKPDQIAPTENDRLFRRRLLVGTVHDQGAAMQGGVAGHAGLFSNANDLAKVGQMLLQEGYYGGVQYYKPETVRTFTQKQYELSRRGLGWDKPIQSEWSSPTSLYASPKTFGHTGFTGTCIWIDPEFNLVYIFLSNRVHPDMTNNKLLNANIRSRIQDVIYRAIFSHCENPDTSVSFNTIN